MKQDFLIWKKSNYSFTIGARVLNLLHSVDTYDPLRHALGCQLKGGQGAQLINFFERGTPRAGVIKKAAPRGWRAQIYHAHSDLETWVPVRVCFIDNRPTNQQ